MKYESVFIIRPDLSETEIEKIQKKVEELIVKNGGSILEAEQWGKKRLAYHIKKHKYGYYVLIRFDLPSNHITTLDRFYRLSEHIIKFLTTKLFDLKSESDITSLPVNSDKKEVSTQKTKDKSNGIDKEIELKK